MVHTFVRKPVPVQAMRWLPDATVAMRKFVEEHSDFYIAFENATLCLHQRGVGETHRAELGDWVLKDSDKRCWVCKHDEFVKTFESIDESINRSMDTSAIIDKLNTIQEGYKVFTEELKSILGIVSPSEHCESTVATCRPEYEHLVDVTTSSDIERTGGIRIYCPGPGCDFKDLSDSEWAAYKAGCVFDKSADTKYSPAGLKRYHINYGGGVAQLVTPYDPEERFYALANTCFGIRKSIMMCSIIRTETVDKADYERLSFNGDEYIWRVDGARKMISPELDKDWNLDFCEECVYRGGPRV